MAESDEDFVYLGTPISREEDTSVRKRKAAADAGQLRTLPAWKQEVRDEEGRRRFHGAFTGGFSAGFYNTVGSKEGWTPQSFTSSRKSRAEVKQQSIFNFLDDDEKAEMEGNALGTSSKFDTFGFTAAELSRRQAEKDQQKRPSVIPGPIPDELILPAVNSIGVKLLLKMGWRRGYSLKENHINSLCDARREARKAFLALSGNSNAPDFSESVIGMPDTEVLVKEHDEALHSSESTPVFVLNPKQDLHGLGYDPFKHAPEFRERKRLHVAGAKDQRSRSTVPRRGGLFSSNSGKIAPGFGIGALEELDVEDEDIYEYGFEVEDTCIEEDEQPLRISKDVKALTHNKKKNILSGFKPALDNDYKLESFYPPDVPSNFEFHHKFSAPLEALKSVDFPPPEVPPPEDSNLKLLIDGFAALVSRCGKLFEDISKERNKNNPLFSFLSDGDGDGDCHTYYVRKLWEEKQKRGDQKMMLKDVESSSVKKLSAESRGRLLGEKPLQKSVSISTTTTVLADVQFQSNLSDTFIKSSSLSIHLESEKPFKDDPAKQKRFEQFLKDKFEGGLRSTFSGGTSDWSETDRARERLDFEAVLDSLQKRQPTVQNNQNNLGLPLFSEMKFISGGTEIVGHPQEEENTLKRDQPKREEFQWRPAPVLCKRFDIIDPFMGKPPLPRAKSKMESIESFIFTKEFLKSEKIEETTNAENATSFPRSEFKDDSVKITSSEADLVPEDKSIHKPVDLYKAIFSDDSDDDEEQPVASQISSDPKKNIEGVNTTLNRLVAGDFLESLSKELGFETPSESGYPPMKTLNNSKGVTFFEDVNHASHQENIESTCKKTDRGIPPFAANETVSSAGSKQVSEVPSQSGGDGTSVDLFKRGTTDASVSRGHANDKPEHGAGILEGKVEFQTKKHRINSKHQYNSYSNTESSSDDSFQEHRKGKVRKKRHRSRNNRLRSRNHRSSSTDDGSSMEYRSKDKSKEKVGVTSSRRRLLHSSHHRGDSSDTVGSDDDDRIHSAPSSKIRRESSKERSRKHSMHHRHKSRKS